MANKTPVSAADIREISQLLRQLANQYDIQAERMTEAKIRTVEIAMDTLQGTAIKRITGNLNNISGRINDEIANRSKIKKRDAKLRKSPAPD